MEWVFLFLPYLSIGIEYLAIDGTGAVLEYF